MLQFNPEVLIKRESKHLLKAVTRASKRHDYPDTMLNALKCLIRGETGVFGAYVATKNALVYRTIDNGMARQEVLIMRLINGADITYFGNSSRLRYEGTRMAFGNRTRPWGLTPSQRIVEAMGVPQLPFGALIEAGLKISEITILDKSGPETVKRRDRQVKDVWKYRDVHFTGAMLFKTGTATFLFDIDREEIKHGIFNPFIVQLPNFANTIKDAYNSLVPDEVREAMADGVKVLRQGEHFFIRICDTLIYKADTEVNRWSDNNEVINVQARLTVQGNRDHVASMFNRQSGLVSGFVRHEGREHIDLDLNDGWYRPVSNTAAKSFTIVGDVD